MRIETGNRPTDETVFLVSGGAKGITAQCVIRMAERFHCGFILVGRSAYEAAPLPDWTLGVEDETELKRAAVAHLQSLGERPTPRRIQRMVRRVQSQREISQTLTAVTAAGGRAVYVSADVTDAAALRSAVSEGAEQLGPVTGILHGAGVLADKLIQHKTAEDFDFVVSVKVDGLRNLLESVQPDDLTYVVLFSSVAGFYGNVGQADYAIANEVLNKAAHWLKRRYPSCCVLAVDWGPWDGGMVTPALKHQLELRGIQTIPVEDGTDILSDLLVAPDDSRAGRAPQVVVGSPMRPPVREPDPEGRSYTIRRRLSLTANPFLCDHVIGGHAVLPTVCAAGWMINTCEQLYPGYKYFRALDYRALKGIVFDESLADEYVLDLKMVPGDEEGRLDFEALIRSRAQNGRPRYHYSMQVTLRREPESAPDDVPLPADLLTRRDPLQDGSEFYRDGTLFHGPSFQGIKSLLRLDETGLVARCRLPAVPVADQGQFSVRTFNPYMTDVQLQSLLIWAAHTYGYGGLPLRIRQATQYRKLAFGEVTYATLKVRSHSARSLVADVFVHNEHGELCSRVEGAEITLSERLKRLFADNALSQAVVGLASAVAGGPSV